MLSQSLASMFGDRVISELFSTDALLRTQAQSRQSYWLRMRKRLRLSASLALLTMILALATATVSAQEETGGADSAPSGLIAFFSERDGDYEIYLMNPDGTGVTRLTSDPAFDAYLSWSPDGSRIAFSSDRSGSSNIYLMNVGRVGRYGTHRHAR